MHTDSVAGIIRAVVEGMIAENGLQRRQPFRWLLALVAEWTYQAGEVLMGSIGLGRMEFEFRGAAEDMQAGR